MILRRCLRLFLGNSIERLRKRVEQLLYLVQRFGVGHRAIAIHFLAHALDTKVRPFGRSCTQRFHDYL